MFASVTDLSLTTLITLSSLLHYQPSCAFILPPHKINSPITTNVPSIYDLQNSDIRHISNPFLAKKYNKDNNDVVVDDGGDDNYDEDDDNEEDGPIIFDKSDFSFDYENRIPTDVSENFRSGFISIVGQPNMGKSTLLNALLRENLSVSTHRPQTTRHSILGITTNMESQVQLCFLDTPGMISNPAYMLQEGMMEAVKGAVRNGDLILVVTQLEIGNEEEDEFNQMDDEMKEKIYDEMAEQDSILQSIQKTDKPVIVVINKCDLASTLDDPMKGDALIDKTIQKWRTLIPKAALILPCSAKQKEDDTGFMLLRSILMLDADLPSLFRALGRPRPGMFPANKQMWLENEDAQKFIPLGPPLYEVDSLTDRTERFFASEIIRGSIFVKLGKEVPYCCEVRIQEFKEPKPNDPMTRIRADIVVERDSQKGIVVGKGGNMIKLIGMDARQKLQEFLDTNKVFLELNVRVDKNWRKNEDRLKEYGYLKSKKK